MFHILISSKDEYGSFQRNTEACNIEKQCSIQNCRCPKLPHVTLRECVLRVQPCKPSSLFASANMLNFVEPVDCVGMMSDWMRESVDGANTPSFWIIEPVDYVN